MRLRRTRHARRGAALYITVLSTALIVSLLGLTGLTLVRIERRQMDVSSDRVAARMYARSAVDQALRVIANNPNWRTTYANGVETTPQSLHASAAGTLSWILVDTDGSLTNADTDLRLKGVGRVGNTVQVSSVKVEGSPSILDTLQCSVYSVGNMTQSSHATTTSGPFATAGKLTVNGDVTGDVEGNPVVIAPLASVSGTVKDPGPDRTMPASSVWNTYLPLATTIPYSSFAYVDANSRLMNRLLLGATVNPYGFADADGVYYVYIPSGKTLTFQEARIHATLLIELGSGATFRFAQSCLWDPPQGKPYPAMIVKSDWTASVVFNGSNSDLKENSAGSRFNFNPPGEPYNGVADSDQNDRYPPLCRGVYHVIGANVTTSLSSHFTAEGVVICEGPTSLGSNLSMTVDPSIFSNPPYGYVAPTSNMEAVPGTWRWDAAP